MPPGTSYAEVVMFTRHLNATAASPRTAARASAALPRYTFSVSRVIAVGSAGAAGARVHRRSSRAHHSFFSPIFIGYKWRTSPRYRSTG
nr:MAG: hypothetical protein [Equine parapoxvirus]WNT71224.1 MAG: hypothetical protein [Equine parapoxvirus]